MKLPHLSGPTRVLLATLLAISLLAGLEILQLLPSGMGPFALAWHINNHPVSYLLGTIATLALLAISARPLFSLSVVTLIYAFIVSSSWIKIDYLGTPMTLSDVRFFASNLADNAVLFSAYPALGSLLLGVSAAMLITASIAWKLERPWTYRARITASGLVLALATGTLFAQASTLNPALPQQTLFGDDRSIGNGFNQLQKFEATKERNISDLLEIFFTDASTDLVLPALIPQQRFHTASAPQAAATKPDIFVVLEESTFDPRLLAACDGRPACDNPLFASAGKQQESGPLFVHTTAGGTWLSEFAFLSGYDWRVFGPAGANAPLTLAQHLRNPLPKHLQALGYQTIAFYPVAGNFLNAREAYKHYGFEHFFAVEDLGLGTDWHHTRDGDLFTSALKTLDQIRDGRPVFVFLLTIRNHGPHAETRAALPPAVTPDIASLPPPLADYLSRLEDSTSAMANLEKRWLGTNNPRILAWFGDHQPRFASTAQHSGNYAQTYFMTAPDENQLRYVTWYSIRSNMTNTLEATSNNAVTDIAYLAPRILDIGHLPQQESDDATRLIQHTCPHGIALCKDAQIVREYLSFRIWEQHEVIGTSQ